MLTEILTAIVFLILAAIALAEFFAFQKNRKNRDELAKREEKSKRKIYEITILNELNDKIGYSLGPQNIIEVMTRFLPELVDYSCFAYMIPFPEKIIFRINFKEPVSYVFFSELKEKMLDNLSSLLKTDFKNIKIDEAFWGSEISEESEEALGSIINVPLIMSDKAVGLLAVANTKTAFYKEKEINALNNVAELAGQAVTRLQKVVEAENSRMNAMVAGMTDGVVMTDIDYRILVANPAAKKFAGLEDKNDLSVQDFIDGVKNMVDLRDRIEEGVRLDKVFVSEELALGDRFLKIIVSPVKDKSNIRTLGCVIIFRDITKEKEVERIKEDFTSMIVHELRSPLDSIKKITEMMRGTAVKKAKQKECLQLIYSSSSDMLELVNNLLDMAKIEAGKFELVKQPSNIKEVIESRVSFFNISATDAKISISSQIGKGMPENVKFDSHLISEVLNNLISNAIKFNKKGGSVVVQALLHKKGRSVEKEAGGVKWFIKGNLSDLPDSLFVAVTNTGPGIAKDEIGKLFNKFFQAKTVFAKERGTGLGLAITKSIVESHGGVVGAESIEGEGATFYFTIPL